MNLARPTPPRAVISLVPLVDVLLILLVFFMVTSTYLNLDMIPAVQRQDDAPAEGAAPPVQADPQSVRQAGAMVVRIGADGGYYLRGQPQSAAALAALWRGAVAQDRATQVLVLPSPRADLQALVTLMDAATAAGIARLSVIRLEGAP